MDMKEYAMAQPTDLASPTGKVGPVQHEATGEITHWGPHSTQVIHAGGMIVKLVHGESFTPAKDGAPAVILRRKET